MRKTGVRVMLADAEGRPADELPPDELYETGEMWLAGSAEARHRFTALANELMQQGKPDQVVNACQQLLASVQSPASPEFAILSELSIRAQKAALGQKGETRARGLKSFIARLIGR